MLKRMFALSDQGSRDLNKGIAATTLSNLCLIAPVSLLVMVIWELLNVISGQESSMRDHAALFICGTATMFIIVFLTQWLQYNKTYTVAYEESANRRIVLAEKLRKLPLSFFGQRNLSDLTTTIMGDCTALERVFSNAIPQLFGTIFMFMITAIGLLVLDWRMGLCIVVPVPVAALVVFAAKKAQSNAESANMDAKRAAYDGVQEYLDTIQELKSCSREEEYLEGLEKKLDYVVKCSFRNEIAPGAATTTAQFPSVWPCGGHAGGWYSGDGRLVVHPPVHSVPAFCRPHLRSLHQLLHADGRSVLCPCQRQADEADQ